MSLELKLKVTNLLDCLFGLIYNQKCLICGCSKTNGLLCKNCLKDVHYMSNFAQKIYRSIEIYSAATYQGTTKKLIQLLKFSHKKKAAIPLANTLFTYFKKLNLKEDFIIVYPPSFYIKYSQRGYNHMLLIAKEFSKLTGLKVNSNIIKKVKFTKPQYLVRNRKKNIQGSFKINDNILDKIKDKNILLIDDITTSGATIEELIDCFLDRGIKNIKVLVISKAVC